MEYVHVVKKEKFGTLHKYSDEWLLFHAKGPRLHTALKLAAFVQMDLLNLNIQYTQGLWFTNNNSAIKVNKGTLLAMVCLQCTVATSWKN